MTMSTVIKKKEGVLAIMDGCVGSWIAIFFVFFLEIVSQGFKAPNLLY